jgi:hypothetical protein
MVVTPTPPILPPLSLLVSCSRTVVLLLAPLGLCRGRLSCGTIGLSPALTRP